jgi:nitrate reductase assembly molybdenum cofactor insertion protein NarJ
MLRDPETDVARLPEEHRALVWHFASLLLSSPDEALINRLDPVHRASHLLPDEVGGPLRATVVHLEQAPLSQLQQEYADTFAADGPIGSTEPMTEICAALKEAAGTDPGRGRSLLSDRLQTLRQVQMSLTAAESGWVGAVTAVTATLTAATSTPRAMPGDAS